jgi:hypothetical protein
VLHGHTDIPQNTRPQGGVISVQQYFDSILSLLKKHGLYTGLLHVYSSGLDDYMSPLEILFEAVFDSSDTAENMYADRRKDGIPSNKFEQYGLKAM